MDTEKFYFPIIALDDSAAPVRLRGTAFPIAPDGTLVTARHVVDIADSNGNVVPTAVWDAETGRTVRIDTVVFPDDPKLDLALLPNALQREKSEFFPLSPPGRPLMGQEVSVFGYYSHSGLLPATTGFFAGSVVSVQRADERFVQLTLPFPVIEGLSGSPVVNDYNGRKVVGVCRGSESQRILASEVVETKDDKTHYRETVHRLVEFGLAVHSQPLISFLIANSVKGMVVSDDAVELPGLED